MEFVNVADLIVFGISQNHRAMLIAGNRVFDFFAVSGEFEHVDMKLAN